jgi:hypothetical protein
LQSFLVADSDSACVVIQVALSFRRIVGILGCSLLFRPTRESRVSAVDVGFEIERTKVCRDENCSPDSNVVVVIPVKSPDSEQPLKCLLIALRL